MELNELLEIGKNLITLLLGGLVIYFKVSNTAQVKAKQVQEVIASITAKAVVFIKEAEEEYKDTTQQGGKKFEQVCTKLYDLVPEPLQCIISKEMIIEIVQKTFDEIEEYARLQLDRNVEK